MAGRLEWKNCYQCGKHLTYKERQRAYGNRSVHVTGYCSDCYLEYFSVSSRRAPGGLFYCKKCKKFRDKIRHKCRVKNPKKPGPKIKWPNCYQCGKELTKRERGLFSVRPKELHGYCQECHKKYFSYRSRIDPFGNYHCYKCDKYLNIREFSINKNICKSCDYKLSRAYMKRNPEKVKIYSMKSRKKNTEKLKTRRKSMVANLTDEYIRNQLARYDDRPPSFFSAEVVEMKRSQLMLHRAIRGAKKQLKKGVRNGFFKTE